MLWWVIHGQVVQQCLPQLVRKKLDKPFGGFRQLTLLYEFSDGRGSFFGIDAKSNAYIRDGDLLKRIQPNGRIETLVKNERNHRTHLLFCRSSRGISLLLHFYRHLSSSFTYFQGEEQ